MSINSIISHSLWNNPENWTWQTNDRFLDNGSIHLVRSVIDERWTYVVGDQVGYIKLSRLLHWKIEAMRLRRKMNPSLDEIKAT